jgi:hypothetical protein
MKLHHTITDLLDKHYELITIDYDSNFNNNLKEIEETIHTRDFSHIDESIDSWLWENESYGMNYALDELKKEIVREFDVEEDKAENFIEKYRYLIEDKIHDRDNSNPLRSLLNNTSNPIFYYDICGDNDDDVQPAYGEEEYKEGFKIIKLNLKIKMHDTTWDKQINSLLANASYGGRIQIFFREDINKFLPDYQKKEAKYIIFKNPEVGVIDRFNGSGDNETFEGLELKVKLNLQNLKIDQNHKYSYTYDICGMCESWADSTEITLK